MAKRRQKKPADYVRCKGCGRLCEKINATLVNNDYYGPECYIKALAATEDTRDMMEKLSSED